MVWENIVQDRIFLSIPCEEATLKEGKEIGFRLMRALLESRDGIGLAANQIGIAKKVCLVHVEEPLLLINPIIIAAEGEVTYQESCLSFPGETVKTKRFSDIKVMTSNHPEILHFSRQKNLLECICVQHEIDHLNGLTMHNRKGDDDGAIYQEHNSM
jgi:peptide deformylase